MYLAAGAIDTSYHGRSYSGHYILRKLFQYTLLGRCMNTSRSALLLWDLIHTDLFKLETHCALYNQPGVPFLLPKSESRIQWQGTVRFICNLCCHRMRFCKYRKRIQASVRQNPSQHMTHRRFTFCRHDIESLFRITGPLWWESISHRSIHRKGSVIRVSNVYFVVILSNVLNKESSSGDFRH